MIMAMFHLVLAKLSRIVDDSVGVFLGTMFALLFIGLTIKELYDNRRA